MPLIHSYGFANSWETASVTKKAEIDIYWYMSVPFIQQDDQGNLTGLEYEIWMLFRQYLRERDGVDLRLNWIEASSFLNVLESVRTSDRPNLFGASAFSITTERAKTVSFTNAYLPDIMVLVSSPGTPIVETLEEVTQMMSEMQAVTIKGTTYERQLQELERRLSMDLDLAYIDSDNNILVEIGRSENRFGFIDLPIYLMLMQDGGELTRQNFFTVRGAGYGFILPKGSDWDIPFNAFLADPIYGLRISEVISKYLGEELLDFMENLEGDIATSILTKEKELQLALIKNANLRLQEEKTYKELLILGITVSILFLMVTGYLFFNNQRTTKLLLEQKSQIEAHREDIRLKNEQLLNRNAQLLTLNEEKSNLVRILAHDLRSPLSQVIGLADLVASSEHITDQEDKVMVRQILEGGKRLNHMISKILDLESLEGGRTQVIREPVEVARMMDEIADRYRAMAAKKDIDFFLDTCTEGYLLDTDHLLLLQVLENLVSNAVKFSPAGKKIHFSAVCSEREVTFQIADEGPGFSKKDLELAFNPFQRLSAKPTGDEPSTGLGLSIVKRYVAELGGKVRIESEQGHGSTFFVNLPA